MSTTETGTRLAIEGGVPGVPKHLHRRWPEIRREDRAAIDAVLDRGELWGPHAPEVTALQDEWAAYVGTRFCLATNSGTAALHCAVVGAGVEPGDEVIMPAFSFVATAMAALHQGAVPVFCDIDPLTCTIDSRRIEERISERTRAVMAVHVHGLPADVDEIRTITARHGLQLIEDAAQAHGATYKGAKVGALGQTAGFSLNGSKNLSAGEGGLFVTDDHQAFTAARRLAIFGEDTPPLRTPSDYRAYWSHGVGWNYRGHELTAALARSQLHRLDHYNAIGQKNARRLTEAIREIPGLQAPHVPSDRSCVYYRYRVRLVPSALGFSGPLVELRDRILHALQAEGVAATLWQLMPLPAQPVFRRGPYRSWQPNQPPEELEPWDRDSFPETASLFDTSFVLGTHMYPLFNQTDVAIAHYVTTLKKVFSRLDVVFESSYKPVKLHPPIPAQQLGLSSPPVRVTPSGR